MKMCVCAACMCMCVRVNAGAELKCFFYQIENDCQE